MVVGFAEFAGACVREIQEMPTLLPFPLSSGVDIYIYILLPSLATQSKYINIYYNNLPVISRLVSHFFFARRADIGEDKNHSKQ